MLLKTAKCTLLWISSQAYAESSAVVSFTEYNKTIYETLAKHIQKVLLYFLVSATLNKTKLCGSYIYVVVWKSYLVYIVTVLLYEWEACIHSLNAAPKKQKGDRKTGKIKDVVRLKWLHVAWRKKG